MTDISRGPCVIEIVLAGAVTADALRPILQCLLQLLGSTNTYVIDAANVTRIDPDAAELLHGLLIAGISRGATMRWGTTSQDLLRAVRALDLDRCPGLPSAIPA